MKYVKRWLKRIWCETFHKSFRVRVPFNNKQLFYSYCYRCSYYSYPEK